MWKSIVFGDPVTAQSDREIRYLRGSEEAGRRVLRARPNSGCFVCGEDNPHGLHIRFERTEGGEAVAEWIPGRTMEGFEGIVHGGIVSAVLDEAMSKAVAASQTEALTVELRVRLRRNLVPERSCRVRGWVSSRKGRITRTEATLTSRDGREYAHAWATFLSLNGVLGAAGGEMRARVK